MAELVGAHDAEVGLRRVLASVVVRRALPAELELRGGDVVLIASES